MENILFIFDEISGNSKNFFMRCIFRKILSHYFNIIVRFVSQ